MYSSPRRPRVLTIAGSDSGGGAGVQADLKTFEALGVYGTTAITAVTAQNTFGVQGVHAVPADMVRLQIQSVLSDIGADAVKTGMLVSPDIVQCVSAALATYAEKEPLRLVVDPVMLSKSGAPLLSLSGVDALKADMVPLATLITPNIPEAAALMSASVTIHTVQDMRECARALTEELDNTCSVLLKGGHAELAGDRCVDVLYDAQRHAFEVFSTARVATRNTHGTGCTTAAAIAAQLAHGRSLGDAVAAAKSYVHDCLVHALDVGHGHGPLNHAHRQQLTR